MGMFDTVYIEKKEIINNIKKLFKDNFHPEFQTKQLENCMLVYRVSENGDFEKEEWKYRKPKKSETTKIGNIILPIVIRKHIGWKKIITTTTLNIYTTTKKDKWIDLSLEYFRGKLMKYSIILQNKKTYKQYDYLVT